jgi:ferredoxin/flavodoxin---NADP+ reductase
MGNATSKQTTHNMVDVTVVGGGPVGLFAVFYAGLRGCSTRIIDRLPDLGGQCGNIYPEKVIFDVAGIPSIPGAELTKDLAKQMRQFDPHIVTGSEVINIEELAPGGPFRVHTENDIYPSKRVILALGLGAFTPRRLTHIERVEELEGLGLYYFVKDMKDVAGKRVLVVGGGDSAVDWAMEAHQRDAQVTLIHRSDVFQAHEGNLARLIHAQVDVKTFHEITALIGEERVTGARVLDNRNGTEETLEYDTVVVAIGFLHNLELVRKWGVSVVGNSIPVNDRMETNVPGIFAAGDIVIHPSKMKLIATGAAEAAVAANAAADEIVPSVRHLYNVAGDRYLGKRLSDVVARVERGEL